MFLQPTKPFTWEVVAASVSNLVLCSFVFLLVAMSMGFPVAYLAARYKVVSWWLATIAGAAIGAAVAASMTWPHVNDQFSFNFSPWAFRPPADFGYGLSMADRWNDMRGSAIAGAIVGATLGMAFGFFFKRRMRPNKSLERTRGR
jgi:hypothetical protein